MLEQYIDLAVYCSNNINIENLIDLYPWLEVMLNYLLRDLSLRSFAICQFGDEFLRFYFHLNRFSNRSSIIDAF